MIAHLFVWVTGSSTRVASNDLENIERIRAGGLLHVSRQRRKPGLGIKDALTMQAGRKRSWPYRAVSITTVGVKAMGVSVTEFQSIPYG